MDGQHMLGIILDGNCIWSVSHKKKSK